MKQSLRIQHWRSQRNNSFFTCDWSLKISTKSKLTIFSFYFHLHVALKHTVTFQSSRHKGITVAAPHMQKSHLSTSVHFFFFFEIHIFGNFRDSKWLMIKRQIDKNDYHNVKCKICTVLEFKV